MIIPTLTVRTRVKVLRGGSGTVVAYVSHAAAGETMYEAQVTARNYNNSETILMPINICKQVGTRRLTLSTQAVPQEPCPQEKGVLYVRERGRLVTVGPGGARPLRRRPQSRWIHTSVHVHCPHRGPPRYERMGVTLLRAPGGLVSIQDRPRRVTSGIAGLSSRLA